MTPKWISVCDAMPPFNEWIYVKLASSFRAQRPFKQKTIIHHFSSSGIHIDSVRIDYYDESNVIRESIVSLFDIIGWQHLDEKEGGRKQWP